MSLTEWSYERAYRYVEAGSTDQLIGRIEAELDVLAAQPEVAHVEVVSISHDTFVQPNAAIIFSALITCVLQTSRRETVDVSQLRKDSVESGASSELGSVSES